MSSPLEMHRVLHHCMLTIEGANEVMANDMNDAAMKLGAAAMMLASASHAVHRHAAQLPQGPTEPHSGGARPGRT
jgi:hypothetical protein